jgi:3-methyladenine DNA glycosylase/8-oxoguanine DNA glycosylase
VDPAADPVRGQNRRTPTPENLVRVAAAVESQADLLRRRARALRREAARLEREAKQRRKR